MCASIFLLFFLLLCLPPNSTLFPYTTLFRSLTHALDVAVHVGLLQDRVHKGRFPVVHVRDDGDVANVCSAHGDHRDRKSTRLNSSHQIISYAVFCLKKKPYTELQSLR